MTRRSSVLFVCLGNICRSPLAEGIFLSLLQAEGLENRIQVDSAGTGGWHVGEAPDPRSRAVAQQNGIELTSRARQVAPQDFARFQWVIAMDRENRNELGNVQTVQGGPARLHLLLEFHPEAPDVTGASGGVDVPDPYYGGPDGFQTVQRLVQEGCEGLLKAVRAELRS
ncbi:MAG: low molecular weight protein-tyrosine-phosphatase [Gemmatimonadota bacterium]